VAKLSIGISYAYMSRCNRPRQVHKHLRLKQRVMTITLLKLIDPALWFDALVGILDPATKLNPAFF
jgi:hypothetical protein